MNYKKSIAFVLALTMCVSVVASNISLVSDNIGIYADSTENDGSVSYEHVYTYNTELETTKDDYGYSIDVTNVDSVQIVIDSDSYIGFNGVFDDNWNNTEWLQGVPNDSNVVILTTSTKGSSKLYLQTTNDLKVYIGKPIGIKTTKTLSSTDILDTTDYSSMVANYVYDGTLESGLWYGLNLVDSENQESILAESGVWFNSGDNSTGYATFDVTGIDKVINIVNNTDYDENVTLTSVELSRVDDIATFNNIDIYTNESSKELDLTSVKSIAIKDGANADVVTIDNNIITGSKVGETTLVVTYVDGSTAEITVNVKTLAFANTTKSVNKDENSTIDLTSEVASGTPISWTSSDTDVATIDETTGILTPIADGTTTITIVDEFGNEATMEVEITSKEVVQVEKTSVNLETTDTYQIVITNGANPKGYASDNKNVATVDETGLITAVGEGTATITITSQDDVTTNIVVNVKNPTPVEISSSKSSMTVGETTAISVDNGVVSEWKSSNEKVATVDKDGNVTAVASGKVTITATDKVGNTSSVDIQVKEFTINRDFLNLAIKDTYTLKSDTSTIKSFTSADENIATISDKGIVTAVSVGSTTITVEDTFGNKIDVPVSVFDDTKYTTGEVSTEEDENGNTIIKVNKGNATEIKLELSSKKYVYAEGVVSYWDNDTETNVEIPWVTEFDNGTTSTIYLGNLPKDVEELIFSVYYSAYWDNSKGDMVDADVTINAVSGNSESTVLESISPVDVLKIKRHILGITILDDVTDYDFNGDKSLNILDFLYAKRLLLGIIK